MNIFEKLQTCKAELQSKNLPKTGKNNFAHYDYWELADFLPTVVSIFKQQNICSFISFTAEKATLTVVNSETPEERITIESPMAAADLKGCHAIQNMGAVETYQRRYLYMALLDITEPDALDATMNEGSPSKTNTPPNKPKSAQKQDKLSRTDKSKQIFMLISKYPELSGQVNRACEKAGVTTIAELSDAQFEQTYEWVCSKVKRK